jgi:hypothetical protein
MTEFAAGAPVLAPLSLPARVAGIIFSTRETFASIVAHPKWIDVLALTTLVSAAFMAVLLSTDVGRQAAVDQGVATLESWGRTVDDEAYRQIERQADMANIVNPLVILVAAPAMTAALAGLLFAVFLALGGETSYRRVLAVVAHSGVVTLVQQLFVMPLNYLRESLSSPTNLSVFLPMLDETGFLASFLGTIDLFLIWWIFVLAIGLAVLYKKRTRPVALGLFASYAAIGLVIAATKAAFAGAP